MAKRYELSDRQCAVIAEMLPGKKVIPAELRTTTADRERRSLGVEVWSAVGRVARGLRPAPAIIPCGPVGPCRLDTDRTPYCPRCTRYSGWPLRCTRGWPPHGLRS